MAEGYPLAGQQTHCTGRSSCRQWCAGSAHMQACPSAAVSWCMAAGALHTPGTTHTRHYTHQAKRPSAHHQQCGQRPRTHLVSLPKALNAGRHNNCLALLLLLLARWLALPGGEVITGHILH
jgi:hypothetical protein